jgi:hypothetical protein
MARRKNESDEGGREQHLDNSNIAIVAAEDSRERIGMVDAEALRSTYEEETQLATTTQGQEVGSHTNSKTAVVLIESDEIKGGSGHGVHLYVRKIKLEQIRLRCEISYAISAGKIGPSLGAGFEVALRYRLFGREGENDAAEAAGEQIGRYLAAYVNAGCST